MGLSFLSLFLVIALNLCIRLSVEDPTGKMYCNHEIRTELTQGSLNGISLYFSTDRYH